MTGGYNSEERPKNLNGNFKEKGFHHNTMGKNASTIDVVKTQESPQNKNIHDKNRPSIQNQGSNDSIVKMPGLQAAQQKNA